MSRGKLDRNGEEINESWNWEGSAGQKQAHLCSWWDATPRCRRPVAVGWLTRLQVMCTLLGSTLGEDEML